MKLSTKTRYGTRLMLELALHYGQGPMLLKEIARAQEISEKYLSQIIVLLKGAGLVNSYRGSSGGHRLTRPPQAITLKEIFKALEGDFDLVKCVGNPDYCSRVSICVTRNVWNDLGRTIAGILESITLADLVGEYREKQTTAITYTI